MTTQAAIELSQVAFGWQQGQPLLTIDHLTIARGERVFLRGPSGSGKSTLLGLVGGVLQPGRGEVRLLGEDIARLSAGARDRFRGEHLGFIFQMFNLVPYLTVLENVLLPAKFSPLRAARHRTGSLENEARHLIAALGLSPELLTRQVTQLSIGQQQRVAAARALLGQPEIVIADEPTSALDAQARSGFIELLMHECQAQGSTLLFVSHDASLGGLFDRTLDMAQFSVATGGR